MNYFFENGAFSNNTLLARQRLGWSNASVCVARVCISDYSNAILCKLFRLRAKLLQVHVSLHELDCITCLARFLFSARLVSIMRVYRAKDICIFRNRFSAIWF